MQQKRIDIIGSGISALATALVLSTDRPELQIRIYGNFKSPHLLSTYRYRAGNLEFSADVGGHYFHYENYPRIFKLLPKLKAEVNVVEKKAAVALDTTGNKIELIPAPLQKNLDKLTNNFDDLKAKLKDFKTDTNELRAARSIGQYYLSAYGEDLYNLFFKPYNQKAFDNRNLFAISLDNFTRAIYTDKLNYNRKFIYPKTGGIQTLYNQMIIALGNCKNITFYDCQVTSIDYQTHKINNMYELGDYLISTIPLNDLTSTITTADGSPFGRANFDVTPSIVVNVGVKNNSKLISEGWNWIYYPQTLPDLFRIGNYSSSGKMAPEGYSSLYMEYTSTAFKVGTLNVSKIEQDLLRTGWISDTRDLKLAQPILVARNHPLFTPRYAEVAEQLAKLGIGLVGRYATQSWGTIHQAFLEAEELAKIL